MRAAQKQADTARRKLKRYDLISSRVVGTSSFPIMHSHDMPKGTGFFYFVFVALINRRSAAVLLASS